MIPSRSYKSKFDCKKLTVNYDQKFEHATFCMICPKLSALLAKLKACVHIWESDFKPWGLSVCHAHPPRENRNTSKIPFTVWIVSQISYSPYFLVFAFCFKR